MKPPEEHALRKIVGDWLHKAGLDIRSAEALLSQEPPLLYPSCFHSQQAAEKYMKAYLTWRQVEFPRTHSIRAILSLLREIDPELAAKLQSAAELTPYGVEVRYPGDLPEPGSDQAREALALARMVRQAVLPLLPQAAP